MSVYVCACFLITEVLYTLICSQSSSNSFHLPDVYYASQRIAWGIERKTRAVLTGGFAPNSTYSMRGSYLQPQ